MGLYEEIQQVHQQGMEEAAAIWELLENLAQPIAAVNVYKAACSTKCAEFLSRIAGDSAFNNLISYLGDFLSRTIKIAEGVGGDNKDEGFRAIRFLEEQMPLTDEVFNDPAAYAIRQHTFDGIIILAAAKMGKAEETKAELEAFQRGVTRTLLKTMISEALAATREPAN